MAWTCTAPSETGSLIFIGDITHSEFKGLQKHFVCQFTENASKLYKGKKAERFSLDSSSQSPANKRLKEDTPKTTNN